MVQAISVNTSVQEVFNGSAPDRKSNLIAAIIGGWDIPITLVQDLSRGAEFTEKSERYYDLGAASEKIGLPIPFNFSASDETELEYRPAVKSIIAVEDSISDENNIIIFDLEITYVNKYRLLQEAVQDMATYLLPSQSFQANDAYYPLTNGTPRWTSTSDTSLDIELSPEWSRSYSSMPADINVSTNIPYKAGNTVYVTARYYYKLNTPGKSGQDNVTYLRTWNYQNDTSSVAPYASINVDTSLIQGGEFYPILPFRINGVWAEDSPYFKDTFPTITATMLAVGLGYEDLKKAVNPENAPGWTSNDMPLEDLDDAVLLFGVDMSLDEDIFNRYLFQAFLSYHYSLAGATQAEWYTWRNNSSWETLNRPRNMIEIRTSTLVFRLEYQWSSVQVRTGNISTDSLYSATSNLPNQPGTVNPVTEPASTAGQVVRLQHEGTEYEGSQSGIHREDRLVLRKPLGTSTTQYIEVVVFGLNGIYDVQRNGWQEEGQFRVFMYGDRNWSNGNMVLPLSRDFVRKFNKEDEEEILYRTLQIMLYASNVYSLGFFQSNLFKFAFFVFKIITIIIPGMYQLSSFLAAVASEGFKAAATALILLGLQKLGELIVLTIVVGVAAYLVISVFGMDVGMVMYAIIAIAAAYSLMSGASVIGLNAAEMLTAANAVDMAVNTHIAKNYMELSDDIKDYDKSLKEKQDAMKDEVDGLGVDYSLSSIAIIRAPQKNEANETVTAFYNRTIHTKNVGVLSLLAVQTAVSGKLELPLPDYNLGTRYA